MAFHVIVGVIETPICDAVGIVTVGQSGITIVDIIPIVTNEEEFNGI